MEDLKNTKKKIYNALLESGVSQEDAITATSSAMREIRNKIYPSHTEDIQKMLEKEYENKTFFKVLQHQSKTSGIPFDLRDEIDVLALECDVSDYEKNEASKCFEMVRHSEFDCSYKPRDSMWIEYEFEFLICQYCKTKQRYCLDEAIEHSSREVFILMYLYQTMQACVENIDNLRSLANEFQIGTKIGDKIILKLAARFVVGFKQLVKLMNSLDLILDCKDILGEIYYI